MDKLDVRHYLDIYTTRKEMQEKGLTNPSEQFRKFTSELLEKLKTHSLDEEIVLKNQAFYDSKENLIITIPLENDK